jgi:hypothetical protein
LIIAAAGQKRFVAEFVFVYVKLRGGRENRVDRYADFVLPLSRRILTSWMLPNCGFFHHSSSLEEAQNQRRFEKGKVYHHFIFQQLHIM